MKKMMISLAAGVVFAGAAATSVSAQDYRVQEGDTLSDLSQEFDVSVDDLKDWNDLDSDLIIIDQLLEIKDEDTPDKDVVEQDEEQQEVQAEPEENQLTEEQEDANAEESQQEADEQDEDNKSDGETMTMTSTAYTADCEGCSGTTTDGTDLNGDEDVVAVDTDEIPLGTEVHIEGYGDAVAADTGGAINGDKIDLHMEDEEDANAWGNQEVEVTVKE